MFQTFRAAIQTVNFGPHLIYILLLGLAIARNCMTVTSQDALSHLLWPPVLWLILLNSFSVPILYAFKPPSIPNRAQLLKKDPVRRASYPEEVRETGENGGIGCHAVCYTVIVLYAFGLATRSATWVM